MCNFVEQDSIKRGGKDRQRGREKEKGERKRARDGQRKQQRKRYSDSLHNISYSNNMDTRYE